MTSPLRSAGRSALVALCGLVAASAGALAAPRSVSDCESLKNDLAYNQCLAMFGPEARNVGGGDGGGGGGGPAMTTANASANAAEPVAEEPAVENRRGRRGRARYTRRGRQVAAFAIGEETPRSHRRRRRH